MDSLKKSRKISEELLKIKAVFLSPRKPFTWASGIKSPIYCDNRLTLGNIEVRKEIEQGLAEAIKEYYPDVEVLMGTSTAGIPHAAYVSDILALPMGYVRSSNKTHGRENKIEGANPNGKNVVVIEDLISTGGSCIEVVQALRDAGANVLGVISIFTYTLKKGIDSFKEIGCEVHSLADINVLVSVAEELNYISSTESAMILKFISNPQDDSWISLE